ncbi:MAG TPA: FAD:protein FMN transferase [Spongiibacteraceae bacterium]
MIVRIVLIIACVLQCACTQRDAIKFVGETQGTSYHITLVAAAAVDKAALQQRTERRLAEIDGALSNYRADSELSRFNRAPIGEWIALSADLYAVLQLSQQISVASDGAFDITIAPLVQLWGFGPDGMHADIPNAMQLQAAKAQVDYRQLQLDPAAPRAKKLHALSIDVNGIAQGYTVDQLAALFAAAGHKNYLIEVGGELRLVGTNAEKKPWRIAIEKPSDGLIAMQQAIVGSEIGVTTAGDYHDYFEKDGVRYSHTIDPRSARPIAHRLAAVTVVAATAALADGWDTALEVLGPEQGYALAQHLQIAAYFIIRQGDTFETRYTEAMQRYLDKF